MALTLGQTGTADSVDAEYFNWESSDRRFLIHMHLDAIDGLARDLVAGLPSETGGILLGQVGRGERPVIWIERYHQVSIGHRQGPRFVLDAEEHAAFERAARDLSESGELSVVGYFRAHVRPGFQLEASDRELVARYYTDAEDLILLLRPEKNKVDIAAQFYGRDPDPRGDWKVLGPAFPFRGRVPGLMDRSEADGTPEEADGTPEEDDGTPEEDEERTGKTVISAPIPEPRNAAAPRRLVPDFQPAPEDRRPAREFFMDPRITPAPASEEPESAGVEYPLRKWWPLLAAILAIAILAGVITQQSSRREPAPVRPLGLYVDSSGPTWRVSWNTSATALPGARVKLFVRDGDQTQVDLQPQDLQSGTYAYSARGRDVTFRLEVVDSTGIRSAESFRLVEPAPLPPAPATPENSAAAPKPETSFTPPKAIHKVQAVVPASLRPRIQGTIPLDVRVKIDEHGKVVSAVPTTKLHAGLEKFLAARAVLAARQWRFSPARQDGKPVQGVQIIHFVFEK